MGANAASEMGIVMELVRSLPGMGVLAKPELKKISLKQILVLFQVIERGLAPGGPANALLDTLSKAEAEEIMEVAMEMLDKAGLRELNEKLKLLTKN